jgi:hypothetical protein
MLNFATLFISLKKSINVFVSNFFMALKLTKPVVVGYAALVNAGSFGLFYYDKQQALKRKWRVPEKTLQLSALIGTVFLLLDLIFYRRLGWWYGCHASI